MSETNGHTMRGLTRAILICVGAAFVLFGGLFVAACIGTLAQGANNPAAAKVGVTVQVITTVIFSLVAIAGVFMIWLGVQRGAAASNSRIEAANVAFVQTQAAKPTPVPAAALVAVGAGDRFGTDDPSELEPWRHDDTEDDIELDPRDAPYAARLEASRGSRPADAQFGEFIAGCGPEVNGLLYNYASAGIYLALGLGGTIALPFMELAIRPGLGVVIPAVLGLAAALLHVWKPLFGAPQSIELYERGIVERLGQQVRHIELSAIEHLEVREWYEHRFANRTFLIKARLNGQQQLSFSTALRGDGDAIVDFLMSTIPQTEFVEFKV
jgi:hypothetical protein